MKFNITQIFVAALALLLSPTAAAAGEPIPVRVVVVTAFEIGEDTGDAPGEFQAWASILPQAIPFPAGFRNLRYDPASGVLALNTGMGTNRAASSVMALGLDPRFDFSRAYWLVAAIAGVNPNTASAGSAAWIGDVVDTDFGFQIDPRETPKGWPTGYVPWERTTPYQQPAPQDKTSNLFPLNKGLRDWAYQLTRDMKLPDGAHLQSLRAPYRPYPPALVPPRVMTGDEATGQSFWHGALLNTHAERWTEYWTEGKGRFVMTAMEDSGVARALEMLDRAGKADADRLLVLRTGSNYTLPPPGVDAATSLGQESNNLSALHSALDAAFAVGNRVVREITGNWAQYADKVPGTGSK